MLVHELVGLTGSVLTMAAQEMAKKAPDYAPEGLCFVDIIKQCAEADIPRPEQLLWALLSKHTTALRHYCLDGHLASELLSNRAFDTINYTAILYIWALQYHDIMQTVMEFFHSGPCLCHLGMAPGAKCDRCLVLDWYAKYHRGFRMD
jgi:hypothetical protein